MRLERYFYTESLQERQRMAERWKLVEPYIQLPSSDSNTSCEESTEPEEPYTYNVEDDYIFNMKKYDRFQDMVDLSIELAEKICSNLFINFDNEEFCGDITFISELLMYDRETKPMFDKLAETSTTVLISQAYDSGEHSPLDVNDAVQMTFFFDCYDKVELD